MNTIDYKKIGSNIERLIKESRFKTAQSFALECDRNPITVKRWIQDGVDNINIINEIATKLDIDAMAILKGAVFN